MSSISKPSNVDQFDRLKQEQLFVIFLLFIILTLISPASIL
jgi:hypothetical protein